MSDFQAFSLLASIVERLNLKGYKQPTPIQKECIPALIDGNDLLGIAQTGTGKTAAFSLPIINKFGRDKIDIPAKSTRSLILTPTRELASQIMQNIDDYAEGLALNTKVVYGGVGRQPQVDAIAQGLDILVATNTLNEDDLKFCKACSLTACVLPLCRLAADIEAFSSASTIMSAPYLVLQKISTLSCSGFAKIVNNAGTLFDFSSW